MYCLITNIKYMTAITVNLSDHLLEFVKTFAKQNNITQREVIEKSLEKTKKQLLKEEIIRESKEIFNNKELQKECLWLANSWLEDYNNNLKQIENAKY